METPPPNPYAQFSDEELKSIDFGLCEQRWDLMDGLHELELTIAALRKEIRARHAA